MISSAAAIRRSISCPVVVSHVLAGIAHKTETTADIQIVGPTCYASSSPVGPNRTPKIEERGEGFLQPSHAGGRRTDVRSRSWVAETSGSADLSLSWQRSRAKSGANFRAKSAGEVGMSLNTLRD